MEHNVITAQSINESIKGLPINQIPILDNFPLKDQALRFRTTKIIHNRASDNIAVVQRDPTFLYTALYATGGARSIFISPEYSFEEIGRIEDVESYVAEAFRKKIGLMFKAGYSFTGANLKTVKYIKERFKQIALASQISTKNLIRQLGESYVKKSNAFAVKVRKRSASGGRIRKQNSKTIEPVAAYFPSPVETMKFKIDKAGKKVIEWSHELDASHAVSFAIEDIGHFIYNKKDGFVFGTPTLIPVIDDIMALRKIEENVEMLIYQHLFPLFHYKIGTENNPAGWTEDGVREVDVARTRIRYMPSEGGIVTDHRHDLKLLGIEGKQLRIEAYLDHFKKRVFSGLGCSGVDFGEGSTVNRATSQTMSRNLIDSVKDLQSCFAAQFDELIIKELLLESDFTGTNPIDDENMVHLTFNEIDIDEQIKLENHVADQFIKNMLTHSEARRRTGKEPIAIPTQDEIKTNESLDQKYPEWFQTCWKLIDEPKMLIQSIDEPYSSLAKAAAKSRSLELGQKELQEEKKEIEEKERKETTAKSTTKKDFLTNSLKITNESIFFKYYQEIEKMTLNMAEAKIKYNASDMAWLKLKAKALFNKAKNELLSHSLAQFNKQYLLINPNYLNLEKAKSIHKKSLKINIAAALDRLEEDLFDKIEKNIDSSSNTIKWIQAIFDSLRYRVNFIDRNELRRGFILGKAIAYKDKNFKELKIKLNSGACNICKEKANSSLKLTEPIIYLPPFHPNCSCDIIKGD